MPSALRISSVCVLGERRVQITLTDGEKRVVDLSPYLTGPMFDSIREHEEAFAQVRVDPEFGSLEWLNGADICPDVLIYERPPA